MRRNQQNKKKSKESVIVVINCESKKLDEKSTTQCAIERNKKFFLRKEAITIFVWIWKKNLITILNLGLLKRGN